MLNRLDQEKHQEVRELKSKPGKGKRCWLISFCKTKSKNCQEQNKQLQRNLKKKKKKKNRKRRREIARWGRKRIRKCTRWKATIWRMGQEDHKKQGLKERVTNVWEVFLPFLKKKRQGGKRKEPSKIHKAGIEVPSPLLKPLSPKATVSSLACFKVKEKATSKHSAKQRSSKQDKKTKKNRKRKKEKKEFFKRGPYSFLAWRVTQGCDNGKILNDPLGVYSLTSTRFSA